MVIGQISSKISRKEFSIFITFSDTYTCIYAVWKIWADSDQNWTFNKFLKLLKNQAKDPVLF